MPGKQQKYQVPLILVSLLTSQLMLMSLQARHPETGHSLLRVWTLTAFAPFLSIVSHVASTAGDVWHDYADLRRVRQQNEMLRREVVQLQLQLHQDHEAVRLAQRLEQLTGVQQSLPGRSVIARVVGRDVTAWFQTIMINRGAQDGVQLNAVVLTPSGLVGRVMAVGPLGSQVQLITDERSGAGAVIGVLGQSRALGVVEGRGEGTCKMRYIPGSEPVAVGEVVYTTGQDGIYPRGIPIGRVLSVEKGSAIVSHDITLEPLAQVGKLEEVVVLLDRPERVRLDSTVVSETQSDERKAR